MTTRSVSLALAALALGAPLALAAGNTVPAPAAAPAADPAQVEIERLNSMYRAIASYNVVLSADEVPAELVTSTLFDVERYVAEMDNRYATSQLFVNEPRALDDMKKIVAKAHFEAAVLHARGVDLENSIVQYEKAMELLGSDPTEWKTEIERSARPSSLANATEIAYEVVTPKEAMENLKQFWSAGVVARFKLREFTPAQRDRLRIQRIGGSMDDFHRASFELAQARFTERTAAGLEEFRVVLPPGRYRVAATDDSLPALEFHLYPGSAPDPVILDPNTFSMGFVNPDDLCRPTLTLNGLAVRHLTGMNYGTYVVTAPATCKRRLPEKITIEQASEVTLRTEPEKLDYAKPGEPIFVFVTTPPGSTYNLRF